MKSVFGRALPIFFFVFVFLSIANLIYTHSTLSSLRNSEERYDRRLFIVAKLDTILINIMEAETNLRGYLLTGEVNYQGTIFDESLPKTEKSIRELKQLLDNDNTQLEKVDSIERLIRERIVLIRQAIMAHDEQGVQGVQAFLLQGLNKNKMDEIITLINGMITEQEELLASRQENIDMKYRTVRAMILVTNFTNIGLLILLYFFVFGELKTRTQEERLKDEFINMASHELKTPVTSLKIFTHVLDKKLHDGKLGEAKRYIAKLNSQMNKLTLLISDLLDLSRIQTGKMRFEKEGFNMDALIDETIEEIQATTKQHQIVTKGSVNRMIYADRYRIYQVLINLLSNAVKYSPNGGKIVVSPTVKDDKLLVYVHDHGIGIESKFRKKIFERLYQVTDSREKTYPGLGVGLYVSAFIIKEHKGSIWVESEKGEGSTFYFTLPIGAD